MAWLQKLHHPEYYIKTFIKWVVLGLLIGSVGGLLGAGFHHALHFVTHLRGECNWLIFLLPLGGLLSVGIYRLFGLRNNRGTNEIIDSILDGKPVSPMVAPDSFQCILVQANAIITERISTSSTASTLTSTLFLRYSKKCPSTKAVTKLSHRIVSGMIRIPLVNISLLLASAWFTSQISGKI